MAGILAGITQYVPKGLGNSFGIGAPVYKELPEVVVTAKRTTTNNNMPMLVVLIVIGALLFSGGRYGRSVYKQAGSLKRKLSNYY